MFITILLTTIIAIEGGMGSGKSTLNENLQQYSNKFKYFPESLQYLNKKEYDELWNNAGSIKALKLLFTAEERRYQDILKHNYTNGSFIILDRSYLTFGAYEYAKNNITNFNNFNNFVNIYKNKIAIPQYIIFLNTNSNIRAQRIFNRGDVDLPDYSMVQNEFNTKLMQYFKIQQTMKVYFIDTSLKKPEEVLNNALQIIQETF